MRSRIRGAWPAAERIVNDRREYSSEVTPPARRDGPPRQRDIQADYPAHGGSKPLLESMSPSTLRPGTGPWPTPPASRSSVCGGSVPMLSTSCVSALDTGLCAASEPGRWVGPSDRGGSVNAAYEAIIPLRVQGLEGRNRDIEAVVDTGYSGFLTLPVGKFASTAP